MAVRFQQLAGLKRVKVFWEEIVLQEVLDQVNLIREWLTCVPGSADAVEAPEGCMP